MTPHQYWHLFYTSLSAKLEWLARWLNNSALVSILGKLTALSILWVAIQYVFNADERRRQRHYQAWQVINSATAIRGSGGRIDALQELNHDHVNLAGIDLSESWLRGIHLPHAELAGALLDTTDLDSAYLAHANLDRAQLQRASLRLAILDDANLHIVNAHHSLFVRTCLRRAIMDRALFTGAQFVAAVLDGADLRFAILQAADFDFASLKNADLGQADVAGAWFRFADLEGARLAFLRNWRSVASLAGANIAGVESAPPGFIAWAVDTMGAVELPPDEWKAVRERASKGDVVVFNTPNQPPGVRYGTRPPCEVLRELVPEHAAHARGPCLEPDRTPAQEVPSDSVPPQLIFPDCDRSVRDG